MPCLLGVALIPHSQVLVQVPAVWVACVVPLQSDHHTGQGLLGYSSPIAFALSPCRLSLMLV